MALEQDAGTGSDHDQELEANGYRPSVKLAPHDELRLLDEALEEAKGRPRPPQVSYAAPPVPVRPRAIAASINPPARRQVEDRRANGHAPDGRDRHELHESFEPYQDAEDESGAEVREGSTRRRRVDIADILAFSDSAQEPDEEPAREGSGPVDRKRLLAAIICILHEELSRSK